MPILKQVMSFEAGELSPMLDGRTDLQKYASGCRSLKNFIPTPQGALIKRPGLQRVGLVKQEDTDEATWYGQIVEFQITNHRSVMLILGGGRMKFVDKGRMLREPVDEDHPDLPRQEIRIPIPWADADLRLLRWKQINSVMYFVHPLHHPHVLTRFTPHEWDLKKVNFGLDAPLLDENIRPNRKITTFFNSDANFTTWAAGQSYERGDRVKSVGSKVWLCRHDHTSTTGNKPEANTSFHDADDDIDRPLWLESFSDNSSDVDQWVLLTCNAAIFKPGHVGSTWEIAARRGLYKYEIVHEASAANDCTATGADPQLASKVLVVQGDWNLITFGTWDGEFVLQISTDHGDTWTNKRVYRSDGDSLRNASDSGTEEKRVLMRLKYQHNGSGTLGTSKPYCRVSVNESRIRGLVEITQWIDERNVRAKTLSPVEKTTTSVWSEGAWSDHQGFPRAIEFHQNRLLMAATTRRPHTIWGSALDDYPNFNRGTEADEAFVHTLAIGSRDPILWMHSDRTLVVGNGAGEFTLRGEKEDSEITPEFGICTRHSSFGTHAGGVGCIVSDTVSLFVQNGGRAIREMAYSFQSDKYESSNLNLLVDHLFKNSIEAVAIQRQPFQILWVVAGGQLFSLTYERSQGVVAWARHSVGGRVVAVGCSRRSAEDGGYFLIRRGGELAIERFVPDGFIDPKNNGAWMDGATTLVHDSYGYNLAGHPLLGRLVCGFANGRPIPPGTLSTDYLAGVTGPVRIGIPYRAVCWPMTPEVGLENGTSRTRECRIHAIVPSVYQSRGGKFGENPDGPLDPLQPGGTGLFTGSIEKPFDGRFSEKGDFCIVSDEPYPFTLRNVTLKLNFLGDVR